MDSPADEAELPADNAPPAPVASSLDRFLADVLVAEKLSHRPDPPLPKGAYDWKHGIPRRFSIMQVFTFTFFAACMMAVGRLIGCPPQVPGFLLFSMVVIAIGQSLTANKVSRKLISVSLGALLVISAALIAGLYWSSHNNRFGLVLIFPLLCFGGSVGVLYGYLVGWLVAGIALVAARVDARVQQFAGRGRGIIGNQATSPFDEPAQSELANHNPTAVGREESPGEHPDV